MQTIADHLKTAVQSAQATEQQGIQVADAAEVLSGAIANTMMDIEPAAGPANSCARTSLRVAVPEAGTEKAYLVNPGTEVILQGVALADTTRAVDGGNLIITTPNGSKIILLDYVNSADVENCEANLKGTGSTMAKKLAKAELDLNDIAPAAGEPLPVNNSPNQGGIQIPGLLGGVGGGEAIYSSILAPFAIGRGTDSIREIENPIIDLGPNTQPPVIPVARPVDAVDDVATTRECINHAGQPVTINVLGNDTDADGSVRPTAAEILSFTNPSNGTVVRNANGTFTYTPNAGFDGLDTFTYTVRNADGSTDTATVRVTVTPTTVDAVNDTASLTRTNLNGSGQVVINVKANDVDAEGDAFSVTRIVAQPGRGSATLNADGTITYIADATATDAYTTTFTYEVTDDCGATDIATVTVNVGAAPVARPVDAVDDVATTRECINHAGQPVTINVLGNDTDADGSVRPTAAEILSFTNPSNGTVVRNANGTFTYTPNAGFDGLDTFTYTVRNADGSTDTATVRVTVTPTTVDAVNDTASLTRTNLNGSGQVVINVKANDVDAEGDAFSVTRIVAQPGRGSATLNADGTITYIADATATDAYTTTFTYEVTDDCGATDIATVTVNVGAAPVARPVDAVDDVATTRECINHAGQPVTINVLGNDTDADGSVRPTAAEILSFTNPSNGTVVRNANGTFTYTPNAGFDGLDTFTYTVRNADGSTDTATVRVTVTPTTVDAVNDTASLTRTNLNGSGQVVINVKANDVDAEGDAFSVTRIVAQPGRGSATLNADGTITYIADATATDAYTTTFTYEVTDDCGATDIATVTVNVGAAPVARPVDAVDDVATTRECINHAGQPVTINVLGNDTDADGSVRPTAAEILSFTNPSNGTVVRNANGTFTYTPNAGFDGLDTFTYTVRNADGSTDTATVRVTVTPTTVDAVNDTASLTRTNFNGQGSVRINVLANDRDPEGDDFSVTRIVSQPGRGSATLNADGTITYIADATATDAYTTTFTYEVTDDCGATDIATVTVNVGAAPVARPVDAVDDVATTRECINHAGQPVTINVLGNDTDADGSVRPTAAEILSFTNPSNGTVVRNANGTFTYTPNAGFDGLDTFTYTVRNADGSTDTATVRVTVTPTTVDARNDNISINRTSFNPTPATIIRVLSNDVDAQGDTFTLTRITQPAIGRVIQNADGTVTYIPISTSVGYTTTFTYTITDSCGAIDTATVTVVVGSYTTGGGGGGGGGGDDCPLVIDLDGNGIGIISNAGSDVRFDLDGNGIAQDTAWFSGTDGVLVRDTNNNGQVDNIHEMFNNINDENGFAMLARTMDSNGDGIVNAQDTGWNELNVWVDADQNGISAPEELLTMAQAGIESIETTASSTAIYYEGAYMPVGSIVHMADGSTRVIGDVFFTNTNEGEVRGAATNDLLAFSETATTYTGGEGTDALWLQSSEGHTLGLGSNVTLNSVEAVDARNGAADTLNLNLADVLSFSEGGILTLRGDSVDEVNLTNATRGEDVVQGGETFASYVSENGAQLLVSPDVQVNLDEHRNIYS